MTKKRRFSWGVGIWLLYGGFVLFILACVGFASMQHFDLVEDQYYERGVEYQQQIDKLQRTQALGAQPEFTIGAASQSLVVTFPDSLVISGISGALTLYRPSNSAFDQTFKLTLTDSHSASFPLQTLASGLWKVKLDWRYFGQSYYSETSFTLSK